MAAGKITKAVEKAALAAVDAVGGAASALLDPPAVQREKAEKARLDALEREQKEQERRMAEEQEKREQAEEQDRAAAWDDFLKRFPDVAEARAHREQLAADLSAREKRLAEALENRDASFQSWREREAQAIARKEPVPPRPAHDKTEADQLRTEVQIARQALATKDADIRELIEKHAREQIAETRPARVKLIQSYARALQGAIDAARRLEAHRQELERGQVSTSGTDELVFPVPPRELEPKLEALRQWAGHFYPGVEV